MRLGDCGEGNMGRVPTSTDRRLLPVSFHGENGGAETPGSSEGKSAFHGEKPTSASEPAISLGDRLRPKLLQQSHPPLLLRLPARVLRHMAVLVVGKS